MSSHGPVATDTNWTDPYTCPFCDEELANAHAGFIDHLGRNDDCESAHETWRENVTSDIGGTWSG